MQTLIVLSKYEPKRGIIWRLFFRQLPSLFFSHPAQTPLFSLPPRFFLSSRADPSSSPQLSLFFLLLFLSVVFSLTHSLLRCSVSLTVALSPPKSSPAITLSPSCNTPAASIGRWWPMIRPCSRCTPWILDLLPPPPPPPPSLIAKLPLSNYSHFLSLHVCLFDLSV